MKKIITLCLSLTMVAGLFAQTAEDALGIAQDYYEGTARSMAMGNAFTALGGDLGAIGINPASSGVFRCSQITFSPSLTTSRSAVNYLGNNTSDKKTGLTISNFGTVITFDTGNYTGLLNYNFGVKPYLYTFGSVRPFQCTPLNKKRMQKYFETLYTGCANFADQNDLITYLPPFRGFMMIRRVRLGTDLKRSFFRLLHPLKFHVHYDLPELYRKLVGDNPVEQDDDMQLTC